MWEVTPRGYGRRIEAYAYQKIDTMSMLYMHADIHDP